MNISAGTYFLLLSAILLVPLLYTAITAVGYFPPPDHQVLRDPAVAKLFDLNASEVYFSGYTQGVCLPRISI
jgi:hypothetical protein